MVSKTTIVNVKFEVTEEGGSVFPDKVIMTVEGREPLDITHAGSRMWGASEIYGTEDWTIGVSVEMF